MVFREFNEEERRAYGDQVLELWANVDVHPDHFMNDGLPDTYPEDPAGWGLTEDNART